MPDPLSPTAYLDRLEPNVVSVGTVPDLNALNDDALTIVEAALEDAALNAHDEARHARAALAALGDDDAPDYERRMTHSRDAALRRAANYSDLAMVFRRLREARNGR